MLKEPERVANQKKNEEMEKELIRLNEIMEQIDGKVWEEQMSGPQYPTIFIVGAPRSGTTLLSQVLVNYFRLGYVSNIMARFYKAPAFGARFSHLLMGTRLPQENSDLYISNFGRTYDLLEPHEFTYFWARWFGNKNETDYLDNHVFDLIDQGVLLKQLGDIERGQAFPVVYKNLFLSYAIAFLAEVLPKAIFIFIKREPIFNAMSLLNAREQFYGSKDKWLSVKPKEYPMLKSLMPYEQVLGQVFYINKNIEKALSKLNENRVIQVFYEDFCAKPKQFLNSFADCVRYNGYELQRLFDVPDKFEVINEKVSELDEELMRKALIKYL